MMQKSRGVLAHLSRGVLTHLSRGVLAHLPSHVNRVNIIVLI